MIPYLPSVPVFRIDQNQEIPIMLRRCQEEMMSELRLPGCKSSFFKCNRLQLQQRCVQKNVKYLKCKSSQLWMFCSKPISFQLVQHWKSFDFRSKIVLRIPVGDILKRPLIFSWNYWREPHQKTSTLYASMASRKNKSFLFLDSATLPAQQCDTRGLSRTRSQVNTNL